jgi:protein SCO1/2
VQNQPGRFISGVIGTVPEAQTLIFELPGNLLYTLGYYHESKYNGSVTELNSKNANFRLIVLTLLVGVVSAAAGISLWKVLQGPPQPSNATLLVLPEPRVIADFALVDDQGEPFTLDNLRGRWSLLFFGFTNCPDVCPGTLNDLKLVHEKLSQLNGDAAPGHQIVFVSVDPERDTPEKLHRYLNYFHPDFIGVTGPLQQLSPLTMQFGIAFHIQEHQAGSTSYNVDHSVSIMLTDPQGRLQGVFPTPHDAGRIASELASVIE